MTQQRSKLITKEGEVVSRSGNKTIKVTVKTRRKHPIYNKVLNYQKSYLVHDEKEESQVGDTVQIAFTRPVSKRKNWRLNKILNKSNSAKVSES